MKNSFNLYMGINLIKRTFELENQLHQKQYILQKIMLRTFLMKNFLR
jgi:hypothetical protein